MIMATEKTERQKLMEALEREAQETHEHLEELRMFLATDGIMPQIGGQTQLVMLSMQLAGLELYHAATRGRLLAYQDEEKKEAADEKKETEKEAK